MSQEYYFLGTTLATITASTATNLSADPHPCPFHEAWETVGYSGDGNPIEAGAAWCEWHWTKMEALWWRQLFSLSGIGTAAYVQNIYIRTRTNLVDADGTYEYKNYKATMYRPEGKPSPHYMFEDVIIKFTRLEEQ